MKCHLSLMLAAVLALIGSQARGDAEPAVEQAQRPVYVIPVHEMIERGLLYAFKRGLQEAEDNNARAIVLDMDTPGGRLDSAEQMVLLLLNAKTRTYTFVNPRAISAGAIIAMATDEIYMTPVGLIGDAMPIMMSPIPFGGAQGVPEDLKEKVMSPTIALVRSAAQAKGHDPALGEAMIRPEAGYKLGDRVICPEGQLLTLTAQDAAAPLREGGKPVLSSGTVTNLTQMLEAIGCADSPVVTVTITSSEKIARTIEGFPVSGILLALGLLGLYIEFKTPGLGFPALGGVVCLAIWFWGHHIAGLSGFFELLLFSTGVALLLVELFLIPGFGLTGTAGVLMMAAAIMLSMVHIEPRQPIDLPNVPLTFPAIMWREGILNFGVALVLVFSAGVVLARYLPQTNLFNRFALNTAVSSAAGYQVNLASDALVGRHGIAATPLRPSGTGEFGSDRLTVVARGAFIEQGTPIVVAEARGNRIVVDAAGRAPDAQS